MNKTTTPLILSITSIIVIVLLFIFIKPIPQDQEYHHFADNKTILGIASFWNVISNVGFIFAGLYGFMVIAKYRIHSLFNYILFWGILMTGLGSAYYHYHPNNNTLVWDRLPMTIVFTTFFAQIYAWYFSTKTAFVIWGISFIAGIFSVLYWQYTESIYNGDLRLYVLIQYLPILLIIIILSRHYKQNRFLLKPLMYILIFYIIAKLFEHFDQSVYETNNIISGHSLKHIAASIATLYMVVIVRKQAISIRFNNTNIV